MQGEKARKKLRIKAFFLAFLLCKKMKEAQYEKRKSSINQLLQERSTKKTKKLIEEGKNMKEIMENVDMNYITEQEILQMAEEILLSDEYQQTQAELTETTEFNQDNGFINKSVSQESKIDTTIVLENTPMEKLKCIKDT